VSNTRLAQRGIVPVLFVLPSKRQHVMSVLVLVQQSTAHLGLASTPMYLFPRAGKNVARLKADHTLSVRIQHTKRNELH